MMRLKNHAHILQKEAYKMKMLEYLIELAINHTPINLGSLINSINLDKKSKQYKEIEYPNYTFNKDKSIRGWIDFRDENDEDIIYTLYFVAFNKKDLKIDDNDNVYIVRIACGLFDCIYYNNIYYIDWNFDKRKTKDYSIIENVNIVEENKL